MDKKITHLPHITHIDVLAVAVINDRKRTHKQQLCAISGISQHKKLFTFRVLRP